MFYCLSRFFILFCITLPPEIHRLSIEGSVFYRIWTVLTIYPLEIESWTFCFRTKSLQSFIFYIVNSHSDSYLCYPSSFFLSFIQFWNPCHESSSSLTISYSVFQSFYLISYINLDSFLQAWVRIIALGVSNLIHFHDTVKKGSRLPLSVLMAISKLNWHVTKSRDWPLDLMIRKIALSIL